MNKKKKPRRYRLTAKKGITQRIYIPNKTHHKLPAVVKYFTQIEIDELAEMMGIRVKK